MNKTIISSLIAASMAISASVQAADVKIAFLGGFTGPLESLTPPIYNGVKLAIDQINAQGGILKGDKIELLKGDSTCADATAASNVADRMVNSEKVSAIVGPMCSGATIAAANNAAIPGGVILISPSATSPALTDLKDNDLVYRTAPSDAYQGVMMAKMLKRRGIDEIAISYVNNDYGKGFAEALAAAFENIGGTVAADRNVISGNNSDGIEINGAGSKQLHDYAKRAFARNCFARSLTEQEKELRK